MNRSEAGKLGYEKSKEKLSALHATRDEEARVEYSASPAYCLNCQKEILFEKRRNKFCSKSCSASYSNSRRASISQKSKLCECGKPKKITNKYCDDCIDNRVYNPRTTVLSEAKSDRIRKRILIEVRGHRCEDCGFESWKNQPIPLDLHHKDGNADNNSDENLMLICPNCHAFTDTYKGANAGKNSNRQNIRRKRYKSGLTY
ncbi:MAG: hypothetical protein OHK0046_21770 [Anaerolineae bacterium]